MANFPEGFQSPEKSDSAQKASGYFQKQDEPAELHSLPIAPPEVLGPHEAPAHEKATEFVPTPSSKEEGQAGHPHDGRADEDPLLPAGAESHGSQHEDEIRELEGLYNEGINEVPNYDGRSKSLVDHDWHERQADVCRKMADAYQEKADDFARQGNRHDAEQAREDAAHWRATADGHENFAAGHLQDHRIEEVEHWDSLDERGQRGIHFYTSEEYKQVNGPLWEHGERWESALRASGVPEVEIARLRSLTEDASHGLKQYPDFEGFSYRGATIEEEDRQKYVPGQAVKHGAFTSSSLSKEMALSYMEKDASHVARPRKVFFVIKSKHGKYIEKHSGMKAEKEVLYDRDTSYMCHEIRQGEPEPGAETIYLEEMD
jgi:hypothetical protein